MAKQATSNAVWTQIDTETLPHATGSLYLQYKSAYTAMKAARETFEKHLTAQLTIPQGKRAVFGYNFGKLSIAIVDDTAPKAKATSAVSLASLIRR